MTTWAGLEFECSPGVFAPRQSTLPLLAIAAHSARGLQAPLSVIDMACGTGAIGIALVKRYPELFGHMLGLDISPEAVACCKRNMILHAVVGGARVWNAGDPVPAVPGEAIIVCNPPYLPPETETDSDWENLWIVSEEGGLLLPSLCMRSALRTPHRVLMKGLESHVQPLRNAFPQLHLAEKYSHPNEVAITVWHR